MNSAAASEPQYHRAAAAKKANIKTRVGFIRFTGKGVLKTLRKRH
jgi:hypothetical protein